MTFFAHPGICSGGMHWTWDCAGAMDIDIDCIVIGAGVVGLAVARALSGAGRDVIVLEAERAIGTGTSSRNSEVVHAGLYYPPETLKARYCAPGREMLYRYCDSRRVAYRRLGKLVVAHDESEMPALEAIAARAKLNGVGDLVFLDRAQVASMEPALHAYAALYSPSTGIVDTHALMLALQGEAEDHGAVLAFRAPVLSGRVEDDRVTVETGGREPARLVARCVVNAAGLMAARIASRFEGLAVPPPGIRFAKGNYFGVAGRVPFLRLVYPVPEPGGLGVHLTLDMAGRARFGPDVEWIDEIDFTVDPDRAEPFYRAIRRYWPGLPDGSLHADYCGIRPKIASQATADFLMEAGNGRFIGLYGIESPGLTCCLAIAENVAELAGRVG